MMPLDRIVPGLSLAATFVGMGFVMLGQAVFDPLALAAERIVGGSILVVAATLIVRWTFRLWTDTRDALREDRDAATERERLHLQQITELNRQLVAERQLRISLEAAGAVERRHFYTEEE